MKLHIRGFILDITSQNAKNFRFSCDDAIAGGFPSHIIKDNTNGVGVEEMGEALFDAGADHNLATKEWLANHYRFVPPYYFLIL